VEVVIPDVLYAAGVGNVLLVPVQGQLLKLAGLERYVLLVMDLKRAGVVMALAEDEFYQNLRRIHYEEKT
jgi:hypothetical protein